ncbi:AraC family transcriptional regulator [Variovorax sp. YR216]|uniref:AraC family transcriptional regulator n=1 Tax=Variovorax sp. YR216 TaxID=1882828 RepID=UPI0008966352|nr:AraC family transcriptional regulator [Variovorax sp. YR216]SEB19124.1 AraC-type DNA-binding protein [Variovorax sp. YR216]
MRRLDALELRPSLAQIGGRLTRGATLTGYEDLARSKGLDPVSMSRSAGLPLKVLSDPDTLVSIDSVATLLEASARESREQAFGLLLAEKQRVGNYGVLAAVLREEPTLGAALQSLARYMWVQNDGLRLRVDDMGHFTMVLLEIRLQKQGRSRQGIEMAAGTILRTLRALTQGSFRPVSVCFSHTRPRDLLTHHRVLATALDFSQPFDAIVCRSGDLALPVPSADPELGRALKGLLDQHRASSKEQPLDGVRQIVKILLPLGNCSVERVAERLGTHRRTLNRQLATAGKSVSAVIEDTRAEMAETYLAGGMRNFCEVAYLLGFTSGAEFSRWFRGRFGMTASQWISSMRGERTETGR